MAEYAACFICGDTDGVSSVAIIPSRHAPDGDPDGVALCPDCRDRVSTLIEPLVDRADALTERLDDAQSTTVSETQSAESGTDTPTSESDAEVASSEESPIDSPESTDETDSPPEGYRSVLRLLQNREEPIDRDAAVTLATNAYELQPPMVERVIETALDRGALRERNGKLYSQ